MLTVEKVKIEESLEWKFKATPQTPVVPSEDQHANKLIDAFLKGVSKGKETAISELKEKYMREYSQNIKKVKALAEDFFNYINDKRKIHCSRVYLKMNNTNDFSLLFLIDPKGYLSDEFDLVYKRSISRRKEINKNNFHVSVMFMPEMETLDKKKIVLDGYTSSYGQKTK